VLTGIHVLLSASDGLVMTFVTTTVTPKLAIMMEAIADLMGRR
jgi:hypothetical protein